MTPLNVILGNQASAILILSVVGVVLLAATAALLDLISGSSRALARLAVERPRMLVFVGIGLPAAFVLISAGGCLGGFASGVAQTGKGTHALLWLANFSFLVTMLSCGTCSPLVRHWGLGITAFAIGLGAVIPLLWVISVITPADDAGLLTATGDRVAFGITVGAILLAMALCAVALLSMITYIAERTGIIFAMHRQQRPPAQSRGTAASSR